VKSVGRGLIHVNTYTLVIKYTYTLILPYLTLSYLTLLSLPLRRAGYYTVSRKKNWAKLFVPELRQISTNFDNFWHTDGTDTDVMPHLQSGIVFLKLLFLI